MNRDEAGSGARPLAVAMTDLVGSPACLLDDAGGLLHLNMAWRQLAGIAGDAQAPAHWRQLVHPNQRDAAAARLRDLLAAGVHAAFECRLAGADGAAPAFLAGFHRIGSGDDDAPCWLCIATDMPPLVAHAAALEDMLDLSVDCIKVIDPDGHLVRINRAGREALGVATQPPPGLQWLSLLPGDVRRDGRAALARARAGTPARFPGRSVAPGRPTRYWDNLLTPVRDAGGGVAAIVCISRDVTAAHDALVQLGQSEERLAIAARVGHLGIWDYDIQADRLYCDEAWYRIMGRDPATPVASIDDFRPFIHPDDVDQATEVTRTARELVDADRDYAIEFRIVRPDGEVRWVRSLAWLQQRDGVPLRAVGFVTDITDALRGELALRDANRALEHERTSLARKVLEDPLTGIPNRRSLDGELAGACARAAGSGEPLCVGMVDIDRFKQFNDRHGHLEGDTALRRIASALLAVAGAHAGVVARYGGEEFAFVLPGSRDPVPFLDDVMAAIEALAIAHPDSPSGLLTASCGAVVAQAPGLSPRQLLQLGDEALYEAKLAGRERYIVRHARADGGAPA